MTIQPKFTVPESIKEPMGFSWKHYAATCNEYVDSYCTLYEKYHALHLLYNDETKEYTVTTLDTYSHFLYEEFVNLHGMNPQRERLLLRLLNRHAQTATGKDFIEFEVVAREDELPSALKSLTADLELADMFLFGIYNIPLQYSDKVFDFIEKA